MNLEKERELFEKNIHPKMLSWVYFCADSNDYKFKIVTCDTDKYKALSELNFGWKMWLASASREGYKLVPVEPTRGMLLQVETSSGFNFEIPCGYENIGVDADTARDIYKAMIGACDAE